MRVPLPTGSLVDLTVELEHETSAQATNAAMRGARRQGRARGHPRLQRGAARLHRRRGSRLLVDLRLRAHGSSPAGPRSRSSPGTTTSRATPAASSTSRSGCSCRGGGAGLAGAAAEPFAEFAADLLVGGPHRRAELLARRRSSGLRCRRPSHAQSRVRAHTRAPACPRDRAQGSSRRDPRALRARRGGGSCDPDALAALARAERDHVDVRHDSLRRLAGPAPDEEVRHPRG